MSWQLAAFAILAVGLTGGFAWYERTRPDARVVALVGTLAAFAALGRIAFAAVPNVKPTTDIVLVSGYALGGAPGFVVGAIAALTSNFFFGQGPWTPWQMAGWGIVGIIGAALAVATHGRIHRWPLAVVCFVVGFGFTALQDIGDWVTYSDHSLAQLGVYVGKGLGFDLVHATGCLVFALAFGPQLTHALGRFKRRLNVTWRPAVPVLVAGVAACGLATPGDTRAASATPVQYLLSAQNRDGGFGAGRGQSSSPMYSGWASLGLSAAGVADPRAIGYLERHELHDPGSLERTILALRAAGAPASALTARLRRDIRHDGSVSEQTNLTAFAVLALRAAGSTPGARTLAWLARQQDADGGFNFAVGGHGAVSDVDDTGAVLEALAATARGGTIARAVRFLAAHQNRDGGFPSEPGEPSNSQSTAFAVQGLIAAGGHPARATAYLRARTAPNGSIDYARGAAQTPVWVTGEAEMAIAGRPLPLTP